MGCKWEPRVCSLDANEYGACVACVGSPPTDSIRAYGDGTREGPQATQATRGASNPLPHGAGAGGIAPGYPRLNPEGGANRPPSQPLGAGTHAPGGASSRARPSPPPLTLPEPPERRYSSI